MRIEDIEGIGPVNVAKLQDAGVRTTDDLLANGGSRAVEH
jgi:predicted flap endonuclease-1-like 5' DNA nuclease